MKYGHVLVTGGNGYIGSHLIGTLLQSGFKVTVLDHFHKSLDNLSAYRGNQNLRIVKGDICDPWTVEHATKDSEAVFHLAAFGPVARTIKEPEMANEVNTSGTLRLLRACVANKVRRFVLASTCSVYGAVKTPYSEEQACLPVTPYGATKLACEAYCSVFSRLYGLSTISLRYFNVYGPRAPYGLIKIFTESMLQELPLTINGDGSQKRDYIYVEDVVEANLLALESEITGRSFNVGTGRETSVNQIADILECVMEKHNYPRHYGSPVPEEIASMCADTTLSERELGFRAKTSIEDGIRDYVSWVQKQI